MMPTRRLGKNGPIVSALGLGAMGMSDLYGPADENQSIATIHAALDSGVNLIDTGDFYGMGHNEMLIGRALRGRRRDQAFIQVKFGALRSPEGAFNGYDLRPVAIRNFLAYSLKRLGLDYIDLYQPSRVDPAVPVEDAIGAIADMVKAGYVRYIGVSEASASTIRRAHSVYPISALQIEYSLITRGVEDEILPTLRELGMSMTAYGVLSRGLLTGSRPTGPKDFRAHLPRFSETNMQQNQKLIDALSAVASDLGATPSQVAIAWVLSRGEDIVPLVGARSPARLQESLGALQIRLTPQDLAKIEAAVPADAVVGDRYPQQQMRMLDSEPKTASAK